MAKLTRILRAYRKRTRLTQAQLARLLGVSPITVSYWECGRCSPNQVIVKDRLKQVLGRDLLGMDTK